MRKYLFWFVWLMIPSICFSQKTYLVSTTETTNFSTIEQVNSANLSKGDIVSFKSGDQFFDAILNCKEGVTYNTYGGSTQAIIGNPTGDFSSTIKIRYKGVTIDNLKIFGYANAKSVIGYKIGHFSILNCEIIGGKNAHKKLTRGIVQENSVVGTGFNITIRNNKIHDLDAAIYLAHPKNVDIGYNEMYNLWRENGLMDHGGAAIRFRTTANGKEPQDTWDAEYTFVIHHNNIYNFEYTAFQAGVSRTIYEYNEIHHNLDERIFRGGVKHGSVGKIYDDTNMLTGCVGLIFRYNVVHNLIRHGKANYTYGEQTIDLIKSRTFTVTSTNNGLGRAVYEGSGDKSYAPNFGDQTGEGPDNVISGLGKANYWVHNNLFYNNSNNLIGRSYSKVKEKRNDLGSYFINNTIVNCGYLEYITNGNGLMLTQSTSNSPHTVVNNIIDFTNLNSLFAGRWKEEQLDLDYNIYLNQTGESTKMPSYGKKTATYYQNGASTNISAEKGKNEKYLTDPNWIDKSALFFATNIGPNGTYVPDVRIKENGNSHNQGRQFELLGDTHSDSYGKHILGKDPTGRSFAFDLINNYRNTNDIGALGSEANSSVVKSPTSPTSPIIVEQPSDIEGVQGSYVTFSITATCDDSIGYQWWKSPYVNEAESKIIDSEKYSGATTNKLTINDIQTSDGNVNYLCETYNESNHSKLWVNSNPAQLTVTVSTIPPTLSSPTIVEQPSNIEGVQGSFVTFSITATCNDSIGYQWWKSPFVSEAESKIIDSDKYSGTTTNKLIINDIQITDGDVNYLCETYNKKNPTTLWVNSEPAQLTVTSVNDFSSQPTEGLKVFLEGVFENGNMRTNLGKAEVLPKTQPYNTVPWNFSKDTNIKTIKKNYVDWILIELRDKVTNSVYRKVGILTEEGKVVNSDDTDFSFVNINSGNYYIVVKHRNHLSIISTQKVQVKNNKPLEYDFTDSQLKVYGSNSMADLGNGTFGLFAGDADANSIINKLDFGSVANNILVQGYVNADLDLNGKINVLDYSKTNKNMLKVSMVP